MRTLRVVKKDERAKPSLAEMSKPQLQVELKKKMGEAETLVGRLEKTFAEATFIQNLLLRDGGSGSVDANSGLVPASG